MRLKRRKIKIMEKIQFKTCFNVLVKNDICLHQTLKGAKKCQKIRGGEIIEEQCDIDLFKEIEK